MEKIKVVVLGTGRATQAFIEKNMVNPYVEIIGLILDLSINKEERKVFVSELRKTIRDIEILDFQKINFTHADIIFSSEYRKIIPAEITEKYLIVNCHGGLLPKWRGFAANAWAIMNGAEEIGYSIHRVREELDAGEIYYVKHIPILPEETYSDVHEIMIDSIVNDVPKVLYDIAMGNIQGQLQDGKEVAYCTRFHSAMGELKDFQNVSQYYVNLHRCMAKPLGTGIYFINKERKFTVNQVEHGKKYGVCNYMAVPGKIVNIIDNQLWVKTQDNIVVLSGIYLDGVKIRVADFFRNGMDIGR